MHGCVCVCVQMWCVHVGKGHVCRCVWKHVHVCCVQAYILYDRLDRHQLLRNNTVAMIKVEDQVMMCKDHVIHV